MLFNYTTLMTSLALLTHALLLGHFVATSAVATILEVPGDYPLLQKAVDAAAPGDTITIAPGMHRGPVEIGPTELTLIGLGAPKSVIVSGMRASRVIRLEPQGVLNLRNLTLTGGLASDSGGALRLDPQSRADLDSCIIVNNRAADFGGGIALYPDAHCTLQNSTLLGNSAGVSGGAISLFERSQIEMFACSINRNWAARNGGAVYLLQDTEAWIDACNFNQNEAHKLGGALNLTQNARAEINQSVFTANRTFEANEDACGGAITANSPGTSLILQASEFRANRSTTGAGVAVFDGADAYIRSTSFVDNAAIGPPNLGHGGGIAFLARATGDIESTEFLRNTALREGGGLYVSRSDISATNLTICDNQVNGSVPGIGWGGGVFLNESWSVFSHSLICRNYSSESSGGVHSEGLAPGEIGASSATIFECTIEDNVARDQGGIVSTEGDSLQFIGNDVRRNRGGGPGGITVAIQSSGIFSENEITDNVCLGLADKADGGGMYIGESWPTIQNNHFARNKSAGKGGAVSVYNPQANPLIYGNTFEENQARVGSGISVGGEAMATIRGNLFVANQAEEDGGVIRFVGGSGGSVFRNTIVNTRFDGVSEQGMRSALAILDDSTPEIEGNIITQTAGGSALHIDDAEGALRIDRNALWDNELGPYAGYIRGKRNLLVDPGLDDQSHWALTPSSRLIDAGGEEFSESHFGLRSDLGYLEYPYPRFDECEVQLLDVPDTLSAGQNVEFRVWVRNNTEEVIHIDVVVNRLGEHFGEWLLASEQRFDPGQERVYSDAQMVPTKMRASGYVVTVKTYEATAVLGGATQDVWVR